jgi:hypothetical protein
MRIAIDTNCLIYLVKTELAVLFLSLCNRDVVIDNNVYAEAVTEGKRAGWLDAIKVDEFLRDNTVPIIPTNISNEIAVFRDPGEASCAVLCKAGAACITTDIKAIKKFVKQDIHVVRLEFFFLDRWVENKILTDDMKEILRKLESVHAITRERRDFVLEQMANTFRS